MEPKKPKEPKQKRAARPKKCPYYGEEGHTVQECKYMTTALAREEDRARGVDLKL
jgi:hypothetical protein